MRSMRHTELALRDITGGGKVKVAGRRTLIYL